MKSGAKPNIISKKDYDFLNSHKLGGIQTYVFQDSYNSDAGLLMQNQEATDMEFNPVVPAQPNGCTNFAQSNDATDLDNTIHSPLTLENITHANAYGGYDIRSSLLAAKSIGWITGFFNVTAQQLDMFDTIRLAQISGVPEKRSVSIGLPWYPIFQQTDSTGILKTPASFSTLNMPWHNASVSGWVTIQGVPYLKVKSWQGKNYGDNGWCYMSRALCNSIFAVTGTVAYTSTKGVLPPIQTISASLLDWLLSNLMYLRHFAYGV